MTQRSRLVELVGPAGTGKTALAQGAPAHDPKVRNDLCLWGLPFRFLLTSALALVPTAAVAVLSGRPLRRPELEQMIRLGALLRAVEHASHNGHSVILMDEGPVFALTWLEVFYADSDAPVRRWRERVLADWAARLDAIVRLDADDPVIASRIRERDKDHVVKNLSTGEIYEFTERFRDAFDRIIARLEEAGHLRVVRLRTDDPSDRDPGSRLHGTIAELAYGN